MASTRTRDTLDGDSGGSPHASSPNVMDDGIEELGSRYPGDIHLLSLRCQSATEREEWDHALALAEEISRLAASPDVGRVQSAQVFLAARRKPEALAALQGVHTENVVAEGLREIVRFFGVEADVDVDQDEIDSKEPVSGRVLAVPPWFLWFEPVLTALLLELEVDVTARLPEGMHRARTALFRPNLEPAMFRSPKVGMFERLFSGLTNATSRHRGEREREVVGHFHREDLEGARQALRSWIQDDANAYDCEPDSDPRQSLLLETEFALGHFEAVIETFERSRAKSDALETPERLLAAYAYLSTSRDDRADRILSAESEDSAALAHLRALREVKRGHGGKALGWFRRANRADDIAVVDLALEELDAAGIPLKE